MCFVNYCPFHIHHENLYNFDPIKPHFYIVKLGFTGVYIIFLTSAQNIDYGYPIFYCLELFQVCFVNYCPFHIHHENLYNFDPIKPHFYIVKLGFTGVYIIVLISAQNIDCGYSLEPPRRGGSNEYPQSILKQKHEKYKIFLS